MIKIIHGIYDGVMKRHWFWKYSFPMYRNTTKFISNIPLKFREFILAKYDKFFLDLVGKDKPLEFTFGYDEETGVMVIAIVHPLDQFNRKRRDIVIGRIKRVNERGVWYTKWYYDKYGVHRKVLDKKGKPVMFIPSYIYDRDFYAKECISVKLSCLFHHIHMIGIFM